MHQQWTAGVAGDLRSVVGALDVRTRLTDLDSYEVKGSAYSGAYLVAVYRRGRLAKPLPSSTPQLRNSLETDL